MNSLIEAIKSGLRNLSKPKSGIQNTLSPNKEKKEGEYVGKYDHKDMPLLKDEYKYGFDSLVDIAGISPEAAYMLGKVESGFRADAVGGLDPNDKGLFQLNQKQSIDELIKKRRDYDKETDTLSEMPSVWEQVSKKYLSEKQEFDPFTPVHNSIGAGWHISKIKQTISEKLDRPATDEDVLFAYKTGATRYSNDIKKGVASPSLKTRYRHLVQQGYTPSFEIGENDRIIKKEKTDIVSSVASILSGAKKAEAFNEEEASDDDSKRSTLSYFLSDIYEKTIKLEKQKVELPFVGESEVYSSKLINPFINTISRVVNTITSPKELYNLFKLEEKDIRFPLHKQEEKVIANSVSKEAIDLMSGAIGYIPRLVIHGVGSYLSVKSEILGEKKDEIDLGVDLRRFGFDEEKYRTQASRIRELVDSGMDPVSAAIHVASTDVLDVAISASILSSIFGYTNHLLSRKGEKLDSVKKVLAENTVGDINENWKLITGRAKGYPVEVREKILADIVNTRNKARRVLSELGSPTKADYFKTGVYDRLFKYTGELSAQTNLKNIKSIEDLFKINVDNVEGLVGGTVEIPVEMRTERMLPGERLVEKQARPDGLSLEEVERVGGEEIIKKTTKEAPSVPSVPIQNKPSVVSGETFEFAGNQVLATAAEKKAIETAIEKAEKLTPGQQEQRIETLENLDLFQGNTEMIEAELEYRNLSPEDMSLVILEDGNKLSDIKYTIRNDNGSLATTITKEEIETLKSTYTGEVADGYVEQTALSKSKDIATGVVSGFRVPYVFFKVKGLSSIYDPLIAGERASVIMVDDFLTRFKDSGLFKKGGIFTADSFNISKKEASDITKYYYDRQFGGLDFPIEKLSEKAQDFIKVFDGITNDTLKGAQEAASIYGKDIIPIPNYAPMYASKDIKFVGEAKKMWTTTEHPYFASLLERKPNVPLDVYEQDYRKTALEYMRQVSTFVNMAEPILHTKNLLENEEFSRILNDRDYDIVKKWFQDVYEGKSQSDSAKAITTVLQYGRRAGSLAYLGGRYSTVLKQPLNLVATSFTEGMLPKLKSKYAKDFNIEVKKLPSYVARAGDIAIEDLQGRVGRIFTGALTEMDREVAFVNLNAFLDREYNKFIEKGIPVTEEVQRFIEKEAQDMLDLWHGGFLEGQRPEYYRSEAGKLVLMFTHQLASQANGFYFKALSEGVFGAENTGVFKEILEEKSKGKLNKDKLKTITSILAGFLAIGYLEQVITNLSFEWSTPDEMAKEVLEASLGNIPAISGISYSLATGKDVTLSPVFGMVSELFNAIYKGDLEEISWASGNFFGVPKQIKKTKEGLEVLASGGLTDKNGQMLAPVEGVMEQIRTFLNGRYGSVAAKDYMNNNPLNKKEGQERRWFVPQVEFLQNGDYERKAELYLSFSPKDRFALKKYLTSGQKKKLDKAIEEHKKKRGGTLGVPASFR